MDFTHTADAQHMMFSHEKQIHTSIERSNDEHHDNDLMDICYDHDVHHTNVDTFQNVNNSQNIIITLSTYPQISPTIIFPKTAAHDIPHEHCQIVVDKHKIPPISKIKSPTKTCSSLRLSCINNNTSSKISATPTMTRAVQKSPHLQFAHGHSQQSQFRKINNKPHSFRDMLLISQFIKRHSN